MLAHLSTSAVFASYCGALTWSCLLSAWSLLLLTSIILRWWLLWLLLVIWLGAALWCRQVRLLMNGSHLWTIRADLRLVRLGWLNRPSVHLKLHVAHIVRVTAYLLALRRTVGLTSERLLSLTVILRLSGLWMGRLMRTLLLPRMLVHRNRSRTDV